MGKNLGLYVSLNDDGTLNRTLVSVAGETQLEPTTVKDEVILFSELSFYFYAFVVDRIKISSAFLMTKDTDGTPSIDMNVFEFIQDTVQDLIEEFEEDNLLYGTLTRTVVEDYVPKDDGTGLSPIEVTAKIIACLSNVMEFQFAVNDILRDLRFKVPIDYENKYRFLQEAEFIQISKLQNLHTPEYAFRSLAEYYMFLLIHFISSQPNVVLCECCGRYFIPKTAKKTIYCDRVIKDEKSCKVWGPILKHKLQAQNKKVVEEFDRAKQKMYKRYERATDPNKKASEKDLTYAEYYDWLEKVTAARDDYLAGNLTAEEALKIIKVP